MNSLQMSQKKWLMECLNRNAMSCYGQDYQFGKIDTIKMYQEHVPIVEYETIEPLIIQMAEGKADILFQGLPVAFEITGGSTSGGKLIPYSDKSFEDFKCAILPWLSDVSTRYGITGKAIYWSISPALRRPVLTKGGIKIGVSDAQYLGNATSEFSNNFMTIPSWVGELYNVEEWQLATLYWLIRSKDLELISIWSPTFLLMLIDALEKHSDELLYLFSKGGTINENLLVSDIDSYDRFVKYLSSKDTSAIWSNIKLISCWQDASSKIFFEKLHSKFPAVSFQAKGLMSTEGVVTIPSVNDNTTLAFMSGFYEFRDINGSIFLSHELTIGNIYEVIMTTSGGLYRYATKDKVKCDGFENELPILSFVGRIGIVSDMVGEKLDEIFVLNVLSYHDGFAMLVPNNDTLKPHYFLISNSDIDIDIVEQNLAINPQYAYARKIGQLHELKHILIPDIIDLYINYKITDNECRIGDIKIPTLSIDKGWLKIIKGYHL